MNTNTDPYQAMNWMAHVAPGYAASWINDTWDQLLGNPCEPEQPTEQIRVEFSEPVVLSGRIAEQQIIDEQTEFNVWFLVTGQPFAQVRVDVLAGSLVDAIQKATDEMLTRFTAASFAYDHYTLSVPYLLTDINNMQIGPMTTGTTPLSWTTGTTLGQTFTPIAEDGVTRGYIEEQMEALRARITELESRQ